MIAPSTLLPYVENPRSTNPLRLKLIHHALAEEEMRLRTCVEQETQRMPAITIKIPRVPATRPLLPLDKQARPYTSLYDVNALTLALIEQVVDRYVRHQNAYPAVILLSPIRFLALPKGVTHYRVRNRSIRLSFEGTTFLAMGRHFDVLARGGHE